MSIAHQWLTTDKSQGIQHIVPLSLGSQRVMNSSKVNNISAQIRKKTGRTSYFKGAEIGS